jgi:hypothetical protein
MAKSKFKPISFDELHKLKEKLPPAQQPQKQPGTIC